MFRIQSCLSHNFTFPSKKSIFIHTILALTLPQLKTIERLNIFGCLEGIGKLKKRSPFSNSCFLHYVSDLLLQESDRCSILLVYKQLSYLEENGKKARDVLKYNICSLSISRTKLKSTIRKCWCIKITKIHFPIPVCHFIPCST